MGPGKTVVHGPRALLARRGASRRADRATAARHAGRRAAQRWSSTGRGGARGFAPEARRAACTHGHCSRARAPGQARRRRPELVLTTYGTLRRDVRAARDDRLRLRGSRRGAGDQERRQQSGQGGAPAARAAPSGADRHAGREPPAASCGRSFEFLNPGFLGSGAAEPSRTLLKNAARPARVARLASRARCGRSLLRRTKEAGASPSCRRRPSRSSCVRARPARSARSTTSCASTIAAALLGRIDAGRTRPYAHDTCSTALLRLRQAACHPALIDPGARGCSRGQARDAAADAGRSARRRAQGARLLAVHELPGARCAGTSTRAGSPTSTSTAARAIARPRCARFQERSRPAGCS